MGENKSSAEEGCIVSRWSPDKPIGHESHTRGRIVRARQVRRRTKPVLAVFVTSSMSVARVTGTIRISVVDGVTPYLIAGKEDRLKR
jgi:hypothetical protein